MIGRSTQGDGPDRGPDAVEQQVAPRRIARKADCDRHYRAKPVNEAEAEHPDIGMATDVAQGAVAHCLPAGLARQNLAPMATTHEIPQLVTGIAAHECHQAYQLDVHVIAERKKACKDQNGLAFEEGA